MNCVHGLVRYKCKPCISEYTKRWNRRMRNSNPLGVMFESNGGYISLSKEDRKLALRKWMERWPISLKH
jgi:hypothetical protein